MELVYVIMFSAKIHFDFTIKEFGLKYFVTEPMIQSLGLLKKPQLIEVGNQYKLLVTYLTKRENYRSITV